MNIWNSVTCDSTRPVGIVLAVNALGYAVVLWRDGVLAQAPVLAAMGLLAPERVWAVAFALAGLVELVAVALNRINARRVGAFAQALLWAFVAGAGWWSTSSSLAPWTWTIFAIAAAWVFLRLATYRSSP